MRGKVHTSHQRTRQAGITPAYAGKSTVGRNRPARYLDHPRVCGEKRALSRSCAACGGSPPRMRGKVPNACVTTTCCGITPAYAGKSLGAARVACTGQDHPRVCGEKLRKTAVSVRELGSPPRMRGKGAVKIKAQLQAGITPAYAGKRLKRSHRIGHFSCILCLFHSVLHRASASGGSRAGPCAPPCLPAQNAVPV